MRSVWWDHVEERWADGLLMDLLADELLSSTTQKSPETGEIAPDP
jgi:hypothetical protein